MLKFCRLVLAVLVDGFGRMWSLDIILKGEHLRTIQSKFGPNRQISFRGEDF